MADQGTGYPLNRAAEMLAPLLGVWDTVGVHGLVPDTTLHGRATFDWLEPGRLLRMRTSIQEDVGIPAGIAVIGSDDDTGAYTMAYYDDRGVSRLYSFSATAEGFRWWRDAPSFAQRYSLTVSPDRRTMVGRGELSHDGSTWEQDLDLTYRRAES